MSNVTEKNFAPLNANRDLSDVIGSREPRAFFEEFAARAK